MLECALPSMLADWTYMLRYCLAFWQLLECSDYFLHTETFLCPLGIS